MGDVLARRRHHGFGFHQQKIGDTILLGVFHEPVAEVKRGHQIRAIFLQLGNRSVVNVGRVLDRVHSRLGCPANSLRAMSVRRDFPSQAVGICHDGLHLLERVLRSLRIISLRKYASGRTDLNQVGAVLNDLAHLVLHRFNAIRCTITGCVIFVGKQVVVAMTSGDTQRRSADQHSRPGNVTCVDGITHCDITVARRTHVPHGSKSGL